jgi:hypothetical protein
MAADVLHEININIPWSGTVGGTVGTLILTIRRNRGRSRSPARNRGRGAAFSSQGYCECQHSVGSRGYGISMDIRGGANS